MAEVSLNKVFTSFQRADKNNNGVLTKKEIAAEALKLNSEGKTDEFRLFATFLVGGSDKKGLYPDFFGSNGKTGTDEEISLGDLAKLAAADINTTGGSAESISSEDFKTMFGTRAQESVAIDIDDIKEIAGTTSPSVSPDVLKDLLPLLLLGAGGGAQGGGFNPLLLLLLLNKKSDSASTTTDSSSLSSLLPLLLFSGGAGAQGQTRQQNPFALLSLLNNDSDDTDIGSLLSGLLG